MRYGKNYPGNDGPVPPPPIEERQRQAFKPLPKNRRMWFRSQSITGELHIGRESARFESEAEFRGAENVGLLIKVGRGSVWLGLGGMTTAELDKFKQLLDQAYETARPVCEFLDNVAQRELDAGEMDLPTRLFKLEPALYTRGSLVAHLPPEPAMENSDEDITPGGDDGPALAEDEAHPGGEESEHGQGIQF